MKIKLLLLFLLDIFAVSRWMYHSDLLATCAAIIVTAAFLFSLVHVLQQHRK